jgi:hypothetical protein
MAPHFADIFSFYFTVRSDLGARLGWLVGLVGLAGGSRGAGRVGWLGWQTHGWGIPPYGLGSPGRCRLTISDKR